MHHGLLLFPCEVEMGWGRPANHRCPPNTLVPALRNLLVTTRRYILVIARRYKLALARRRAYGGPE